MKKINTSQTDLEKNIDSIIAQDLNLKCLSLKALKVNKKYQIIIHSKTFLECSLKSDADELYKGHTDQELEIINAQFLNRARENPLLHFEYSKKLNEYFYYSLYINGIYKLDKKRNFTHYAVSNTKEAGISLSFPNTMYGTYWWATNA
jgi:hypothetical protein